MPAEPWSWPNAARLALSLVVNVEEGAESSIAEGDRGPEPVDELGIALKKPIRNYGNESNYRYGIKAGAPRVMRLLEAHGLTATFTAAAVALERAPELAREIVAQGHEVVRARLALGAPVPPRRSRRARIHPQGGRLDRAHDRARGPTAGCRAIS